jgi:sulfur carrier protein
MDVTINGTPRKVTGEPTVAQLLEQLQVPTTQGGIAVCVNGEVVRRADWEQILLNAADEIEIVQATQGG